MITEVTLEPNSSPEMAGIVNEAVIEGPGGEKFDFVRKIAALASTLGDDVVSAEASAMAADEAVFAQSMAYQAGNDTISAEDAAEAIVDRKASAFVASTRVLVAECVESGCETIGVAIGSMFGTPAFGYAVGTAVGHFLNAPVGKLVERGAQKIVQYAHQAWQGVKRVATGIFNSVKNWLFG